MKIKRTSPNDQVLVFAYGTLRHDQTPPKTMSNYIPDSIYGDLSTNNGFRTATNIGLSSNLIQGETLTILRSELKTLDSREDVNNGEYERIKTTTTSGKEVFVYQWLGKPLTKAKS